MPVSGGIFSKKALNAFNPPADAPMPTIWFPPAGRSEASASVAFSAEANVGDAAFLGRPPFAPMWVFFGIIRRA
jgi:hypothetical protein